VRVFSHALPTAVRYAELLAGAGVLRGLIGPRELPRLWERHLVNCALIGEAVPQGASVCDIGSGAGLPGLVLAIVRPDLDLLLVEPLLRRTIFLEEAVEELAVRNVEVLRARAEELHGRRDFDVVTSRAVAPLDRLARWSLPLVRQGGEMVAMKGSSAVAELEDHARVVERLGGRDARIEVYGVAEGLAPTTVIRIRAGHASGSGSAERSAVSRESRGTKRARGARPSARDRRSSR
jgi:16S rRNA (guanine527-N7)-methyltransferase